MATEITTAIKQKKKKKYIDSVQTSIKRCRRERERERKEGELSGSCLNVAPNVFDVDAAGKKAHTNVSYIT